MQPLHHGSRVNAQVLAHPFGVVVPERAQAVHVFAPNDVDKEPIGLAQIRNGDPDVVDAGQPGQPGGRGAHRDTAVYLDSV
jgi:hypothetical protein